MCHLNKFKRSCARSFAILNIATFSTSNSSIFKYVYKVRKFLEKWTISAKSEILFRFVLRLWRRRKNKAINMNRQHTTLCHFDKTRIVRFQEFITTFILSVFFIDQISSLLLLDTSLVNINHTNRKTPQNFKLYAFVQMDTASLKPC